MHTARSLHRKLRGTVAAVLLLAGFATGVSHADTIQPVTSDADAVTYPDLSGLITGRQTVTDPILIPVAGTLTVTLRDLAWPEPFTTLSFSLTDAHTVLAQLVAPGVLTVDIATPGQYFGFIFGDAQGALDMGLYSLSAVLTPSAPPVPLPAAVWLLASGCGALGALRRRRPV